MNNPNDQIKNCKQEKKKLEEQLLILEGIDDLFKKARMNYICLIEATHNQMEDIKVKISEVDKQIEILETMEDKNDY